MSKIIISEKAFLCRFMNPDLSFWPSSDMDCLLSQCTCPSNNPLNVLVSMKLRQVLSISRYIFYAMPVSCWNLTWHYIGQWVSIVFRVSKVGCFLMLHTIIVLSIF